MPSRGERQPVPGADRYDVGGTISPPAVGRDLGATLDAVSRPEPPLRMRGARDIELYRRLSPSVALVVTEGGAGSASLIGIKSPVFATKGGVLLTNAHVVGDASEVGVIFKPQNAGQKVTSAEMVRGRVKKVDPIRDLALIEVERVPANTTPVELGDMKGVEVGADVHAIGHPEGQSWTYTKGLVSQIRPGYEWQTSASGPKHVADVIQTQTPINPGNSGGPLLDDSGRMIGVNSFKHSTGENLNFAVSVGEVEKFLAAARDGAYDPQTTVAASTSCTPKVVFEGRAADGKGFIRDVDMKCSGRVDASLFVPDDKSQPVVLSFDANGDGKADGWVFDDDRDGKWDYSLWDEDFDGKPDLVGHHPDGKAKPTRFERYVAKP
ncbi:MAG: S1C family serine protease [Pseudomonadota bacterium]